MTRRRQRYKRATPGEPFLLMPEWVLNSDPWLTMSVDARVIVIDVCTRWNGETFWKVRINNNGAIHYGCREAVKIGIKKDTAARALNEAIEAGFLDPGGTWKPGFLGDGKRRAREFRITFLPTHGRFARLRNSTNNTRKILIEHRVVKSRAYASLSSAARVVLIEMMRRDNGSNNGRIKFGAEDGVFVRLGYDVTKRAMRELHAAGFIIMTVAANKYRGIPRKWRLTMIKTNGEAATFDFLKRPPENVIPVSQTPLNPPDGLSGAPELVSDGAMDAGSNHVHEHQDGQDPQRVASDSPARGGHGDEGEVWGRQTDTYRIPGSGDPPPAAASAAGRTRHRPAHEIEKLRGGATLHRLPMRHSPDDDPPMKSRALTNDRRGSRPRMRGKADD